MGLRGFRWRFLLGVLCVLIVASGSIAVCSSSGHGGHSPSYAEAQGSERQGRVPAIHWVVGHLETAAAKVQPFLERYGYAAVFLSILPEGFGVPAPGQTLLMAASLDAANGRLNILWVLACGCAAATLGNALGYLLGRWGGRPLLGRVRVNEGHLRGIEERFARHGTGILLVARFFDGLRQLNGIVAGLLGMPWRTFALLNVLGAVIWTGSWGLVVYFIGKKVASVHVLSAKAEPALLFLALALIVVLVVYLLWHRRGNKVAK